ncbi:peptidase family M50 [mine drainage metagenome]|uniref:Peptidase family M50 n=1 Tax=mine drainage metagenome TaxID=410659 RepID=A0A1J5S3D7_9ZZZZ
MAVILVESRLRLSHAPMDNLIQTLAIYALPVIFAITLHEAAHGYVARHFGDPTAWQLGRVSLNPLRHIDPIGTILVPVLLMTLSGGGVIFGWAKPVPVNFGKLREPKKDMLWVAAAGPAANLFMALAWASVFKLALILPFSAYAEPMARMGMAGIEINAALMLLNLLPIPPLDGGRIAVSLLPHRLAWKFAQIERYGFVILLALLFTHVLDLILLPLMSGFILLLKLLFNINI